MDRKRIEQFVGKNDRLTERPSNFCQRTKLNSIFEFRKLSFSLFSCVVTQFVDHVLSCRKNFRKVHLQRPENSQGEIAATCAHFNDRPALRRVQVEIRFHEIVCESSRKQRTRFRRGTIITRATLSNSSATTVVTITLVIERRLHPIMKRHWTSGSDSFAQSIN